MIYVELLYNNGFHVSIWLFAYNWKHFGAFLWLVLLLVCLYLQIQSDITLESPEFSRPVPLNPARFKTPQLVGLQMQLLPGDALCWIFWVLLSLWGAVFAAVLTSSYRTSAE